MAEDLVLYTNPMSRGRIARWMLEEVGAPYRSEVIDYGPPMKTPAYRRLNPMGKVPTLVHGANIVTEVAAICAYLADAFPAAGLAPPPAERGAYYRWLFFGAGPIEACVTDKALGFEAPPDRQRMVGYGSYGLVMDTLEQAVGGSEYIAGARFTAADVYVGSQIGWGLQYGTMPPRPAFENYFARISGRPARLRAEALDNAAIPEGQ
jgi:glutathione S-transferase